MTPPSLRWKLLSQLPPASSIQPLSPCALFSAFVIFFLSFIFSHFFSPSPQINSIFRFSNVSLQCLRFLEVSSPSLPQARESLGTISICLQKVPHCFFFNTLKQLKLQLLGVFSGVPCNTQSGFCKKTASYHTVTQRKVGTKGSQHKNPTAVKTGYHSLAWNTHLQSQHLGGGGAGV